MSDLHLKSCVERDFDESRKQHNLSQCHKNTPGDQSQPFTLNILVNETFEDCKTCMW